MERIIEDPTVVVITNKNTRFSAQETTEGIHFNP